MRVFEFLKAGASTEVNYVIPKADFKTLRKVALREQTHVGDVMRAVIRSFMHEYRLFEARGEQRPSVWLCHEPSAIEKTVRVKTFFPEAEIAELKRIASIEGERKGMKLTAPAIARAVLRAFTTAQQKADEARRQVESADIFAQLVQQPENRVA
jgi:hypothetical protein